MSNACNGELDRYLTWEFDMIYWEVVSACDDIDILID